ncbi:MAG TPA: hypothetical protein VN795_04260 [Stellaceae bacterium]|nr:hypothetical protein [Stellaceae bacterium]
MKRKKTSANRKKLVRAEHMLEADHDEVAFEKRMKKIAKAKPKARRKRKK